MLLKESSQNVKVHCVVIHSHNYGKYQDALW